MPRRALLVLVLLLAGCSGPTSLVATEVPTQQVPTLEAATATPVPRRAEDVANAFFAAWQQGRYSSMYDLLSADAQAATPRDVFVRRYTNIHDGTGEIGLKVQAT